MIKFCDIESGAHALLDSTEAALGDSAREYAEEILGEMSSMSGEGCEVAASLAAGCLLVRIYDEGYAFPYPFALTEESDVGAALGELSAYMRRELLTPIFTDVPREELDTLGAVFHRLSASVYSDDEDSFFVRAVSECDDFHLDKPLFGERLSLTELGEEDAASLFEIATDISLNKFWGYDYREDEPNPDRDFFLRVAKSERERGVAASFALRLDGAMIGEGVIFDFDYLGSAQIAVRLKPEYHGRGLGGEAVSLLIDLSRKMGLHTLRAEVLLENPASLAMTRRYLKETSADSEKAYFTLSLA